MTTQEVNNLEEHVEPRLGEPGQQQAPSLSCDKHYPLNTALH